MNFAKNAEKETLLMTYESRKGSQNDVCFVDTGCKNNMSGCNPHSLI